jgi:hypothetical protein
LVFLDKLIFCSIVCSCTSNFSAIWRLSPLLTELHFFLYLLFYVALKNFSLIWRRHHCRSAKFRPMLDVQGLLTRRDLYRATPAVTRGLVFFRSHPKDRPIQSPLTTHKGIWRIYSNPDSQTANLAFMPFTSDGSFTCHTC